MELPRWEDGKGKREEVDEAEMRRTSGELFGFPADAQADDTVRVARQNSGVKITIAGGKRQTSGIIGAKRLMSGDIGEMRPMTTSSRFELARIAKAFALEVSSLRMTEQNQLYDVLSTISHRPSDIDHVLEKWIKDESPSGDRGGGLRRNRMTTTREEMLDMIRGRDAESLATALLSGIMNGILAVGLNCVSATLVFGQSATTATWVPVGVCMYHLTTIIAGPLTTAFSDCKIAIGGPNIKHALLFGPTVVGLIVQAITGDGDVGSGRRGLAASTSGAVTGDWDPDELLSSIIFAMAFSTLITTVCWITIGHFRLTRVIQFLPEFVVSGFIASVGYLLMLKALFVSTGYHISFEIGENFHVEGLGEGQFYYLLIPAVVIGLPMFFITEHHIGKPVHVLPVLLIVPLVLFYVVLAVSGVSVADARRNGWFLDEFKSTPFYKPWLEFSPGKVNFGVVFECFPDIVVLTLVLTINFLLNLVAIRNEFDVEVDYNKEIRLSGLYNIMSSAGLTAPGYVVHEFTDLNYGVVHNVEDRLPGFAYALFVAIIYSSGYPIINIFPRFFLGSLVIFAGFGFIHTHVIMTYGKMPRLEYASIIVIVLVTALTQLLYAVVSGILMAMFIFVWKYARRGAIRSMSYGTSYRSQVVRSYRDEQHLTHLGQLFIVVELHRFLFFGSVIAVQEQLNEILEERERKPKWKRERYVLIDFERVDGIDNTATMIFTQIAKSCRNVNVHTIVCGMRRKTERKFALRKEWSALVRVFPDSDAAAEWIENQLLMHASQIRRRWLEIEALRKLHAQSVLRAKHEAYENLLGGHLGESLWQYVVTEQVEKGQRLCTKGEKNDRLYLLQSGRLTCYIERGDGTRMRAMTWLRGAYVNEDSLFLDMPVSHTIVAEERSTVLVITQRMWCQLEADDPIVALQIQRTVMMHTATMRDIFERRLKSLHRTTGVDSAGPLAFERNRSTNAVSPSHGASLSSHEKFASSVKRAVDDLEVTRRNDVHIGSLMNVQSAHDFHHIPHDKGKINARGPMKKKNESQMFDHVDFDRLCVHMSRRMVKLTKACFAKHMGCSVPDHAIGWAAPPSPTLTSEKMSSQSSSTSPSSHDRSDEQRRAETKLSLSSSLLPFDKAQDALMDLGKFPTLNELKTILRGIAKSRGVSWATFKRSLSDGVSLSLFLDIVSALDLATISREDMINYHRVFHKYAKRGRQKGEYYLTTVGLGMLMEEMDHPEKPLELQKLVTEWTTSVDNRDGKIDFINFVSMMAHFLKNEELDEEVEDVFKSFCHKWSDSASFDGADLYARMQNEFGIDLSLEEANEMIWEADLTDEGRLDYWSFRNSVTMVSDVDLTSGLSVALARKKQSARAYKVRASSQKGEREPIHVATSPRRRNATRARGIYRE